MDVKVLLLVLTTWSIKGSRVSYNGYKVIRIIPQDDNQLSFIHEMSESEKKLDFWSEPHSVNNSVDVMVDPKEINSLTEALQLRNIHHSILIEDVQKNLDSDPQALDAKSTHKRQLTWTKYYTVNEIYDYMDHVARKHSNIASVFTIGKSYEGRPLKVIKIGTAKSTKKPAIWIDGGIHAREWIAPATATYIINQLVTNYDANQDLMDTFIWYIMPLVNPDGYEYTYTDERMWRKTRSVNNKKCRGTDPNRNFGFHWNEDGEKSNPCSDGYPGPRPFSEPETKALSDFILKNKRHIKLYLSFHAYSQLWLTPWCYTSKLPDDYNDLARLAEIGTKALSSLYGTNYTVGSATNVLYLAPGTSHDWVKGVAGIKYAYAVELRDTGRYGFTLPSYLITPTAKETWEGIKAMGKELASLI